MFVLYVTILLYSTIPDVSKRVLCYTITDVRFLPCYAIAVLKKGREESKRGREAAFNATSVIVARIADATL